MINWQEIDCCSESGRQLSFRCLSRRLVVIKPQYEAVAPVHLIHLRSSSETANKKLRILVRLQEKGLYISRTLVSAGGAALVPVRIPNTWDKVQSAVRKIQEGGDESRETLPDPLKDLWQRSSEQMTQKESQAVAEVLHQHKDVFSLSEQDLGRTNLTKQHIDTANARPIKQHPRCISPVKRVEIERQVEDLLQRGIVNKIKQSVFLSCSISDTKRWFPKILR